MCSHRTQHRGLLTDTGFLVLPPCKEYQYNTPIPLPGAHLLHVRNLCPSPLFRLRFHPLTVCPYLDFDLPYFDSVSPLTLWTTDYMHLSVSLDNIWMLQQVYLYAQPAVGLVRKLQEKVNHANSSARKRTKPPNSCCLSKFIFCYLLQEEYYPCVDGSQRPLHIIEIKVNKLTCGFRAVYVLVHVQCFCSNKL